MRRLASVFVLCAGCAAAPTAPSADPCDVEAFVHQREASLANWKLGQNATPEQQPKLRKLASEFLKD